jgi:hypothetical protein
MSGTIRTLTKLIEQFLDNDGGNDLLPKISNELETLSDFPEEIIEIFNRIIQKFELKKLTTLFELVDYLTCNNIGKIKILIRDSNFLEKVTQLVLEPSVEQKTLCLVKAWADQFENCKGDVPEFTEFLDLIVNACGKKLPDSPNLTYTNGIPPSQAAGNHNEPVMGPHFPGQQDTVAGPFLPNAESVVHSPAELDAIERFLRDVEEVKRPDFLAKSNEQKESILLKFKETAEKWLGTLLGTGPGAPRNGGNSQMSDSIYKLTKRLSDTQEILEHNLRLLQGRQSNIQYHNSDPRNRPSPPELSTLLKKNGPEYSIIVHPVHPNKIPGVFSIERLAKYKTEQCPYGMDCKQIPTFRRGQKFRNEDYQCDKWHFQFGDRRRELFHDARNSAYAYQNNACPYKRGCPQKDKCTFYHTPFEYLFHPLQYKKYRCVYGECQRKNICPYWHNVEEERGWRDILREHFNLTLPAIAAGDDDHFQNDIDESDFIADSDCLGPNAMAPAHVAEAYHQSGVRSNLQNSIALDSIINNTNVAAAAAGGRRDDVEAGTVIQEEKNIPNKTLTTIMTLHPLIGPKHLTTSFENLPYFVMKGIVIPHEYQHPNNSDQHSQDPEVLQLKEKYDTSKIVIRKYEKFEGDKNSYAYA